MSTTRKWADDPHSNRRENITLILLSLSFGVVMFDRVALNLLLPFIAPEFGLSGLQIGLLGSGLALSWAISGFIAARVADARQAHKTWLVAATALFSLASASTALANSFAVLLALRIALGLAEGPVLPLAQTVMSGESSPDRRGFNLGVVQNFASGVLGTLIAPVLLVWLATQLSWRGAFVIASVPGLLLAAACALYLRQPPAAGNGREAPIVPFSQLIRSRNLLLSIVIAAMLVMWLTLLMVFLPIYLVQERAMPMMGMGVLMSIMGFAGVLSSLLVSRLSDLAGRRPTLMLFSLIGTVAPLAPIVLDAHVASLALPMAFGYLAVGCLPQATSTVPQECVPAGALAAAMGLVIGVAEVVGRVIAPALAGAASEFWSPAAPLLLASAGALLASFFSLFLIETAPSRTVAAQSVTTANLSNGRA